MKEHMIYRGLFWVTEAGSVPPSLFVRKFVCDRSGRPIEEDIPFSSQRSNNLNHRAEWARLDPRITGGKPFNYYPRGRVEVRRGRATIFLNPDICCEPVLEAIKRSFGLDSPELSSVRVVADGSAHYAYQKTEISPE